MISAIVLTKNSASTLERTLKSIGWCDEIIVIDDESTDGTESIARTHRASFFVHPLGEDFAQQRNFGLIKAKGEWVLFVDSDEVVSHELKKEILRSTQDDKETVGYYLKRKDFVFGKWLAHGETANVRLLRLAKKDAGKWTRSVHEIWDIQGHTGELENPLLHYPHPTVREFIDDINWYSTLNAKLLKAEGKKSSLLEIVFYPLAKFKQNYIFRFGFLDGTPGVLIAILMSFHSFLTRAKLYLLTHPVHKKA